VSAVAPATVHEFGPLLRAVEQLLDRVRRDIDGILADCRRWRHRLGPVLDGLDRLVEQLRRLAGDVYDRLRAMLATPGDPVALWHTADRWLTGVAAPVSARAGTFTADWMHADNRWDGPAAAAYRSTLPPQHDALVRTHDIAGATAGSLRDVATAIVGYWAAVGTALVALAAQLAAAATATATPLSVMPGAAAGVAAVAEFLTIAAGVAAALGHELDTVLHAQRTLLAQLSDGTAFPAGHWPVSAAADLTDASLTDGDGTDWSLRY
jgi:hypothetical protein